MRYTYREILTSPCKNGDAAKVGAATHIVNTVTTGSLKELMRLIAEYVLEAV